MTLRFYLITGAVVLTLAALSNLAFFGPELFDHGHHGFHGRY